MAALREARLGVLGVSTSLHNIVALCLFVRFEERATHKPSHTILSEERVKMRSRACYSHYPCHPDACNAATESEQRLSMLLSIQHVAAAWRSAGFEVEQVLMARTVRPGSYRRCHKSNVSPVSLWSHYGLLPRA